MQTIFLELIPNTTPPIIYCDQHDHDGRQIKIALTKDGVAYVPLAGTTATIEGTNADGEGFTHEAVLDGNFVIFNIIEDMTLHAGATRTQVVLTNGDDRTASTVFLIMVQRSAYNDNTGI